MASRSIVFACAMAVFASGCGHQGRLAAEAETGGLKRVNLTPASEPLSIARGPDGNVWFTEAKARKIGRITPAGVVTEFAVGAAPRGITEGPGGSLWFTDARGVGKITPHGAVTQYDLSRKGASPFDLTTGPDRALWFTDRTFGQIGRLATDGTLRQYNVGRESDPIGIAVGPDGQIWFTLASRWRIEKMTLSGKISKVADAAGPSFITAGPHDSMWFAESGRSALASVARNGDVTRYAYVPPRRIYVVANGADGDVWFAAEAPRGNDGTATLAKIAPDGVITRYSRGISGSAIGGIVAGPDGNVWFTESNDAIVGKISSDGVVTEYSGPRARVTVSIRGLGSVRGIRIHCPARCSTTMPLHTKLTLFAQARKGWHFARWSPATCRVFDCAVFADVPTKITAVFERNSR